MTKQAKQVTGSTIVNAFLADIDKKARLTAPRDKKPKSFNYSQFCEKFSRAYADKKAIEIAEYNRLHKAIKYHKNTVPAVVPTVSLPVIKNHTKISVSAAENSVKENHKSFSELLADFETAYNGGADYSHELQILSYAVTIAVLKKITNVTCDPLLTKIKNDLVAYYKSGFNSQDILPDGAYLMTVAASAILEECSNFSQGTVDLQAKITKRVINKKIWIKQTDNEAAWETITTTPIQQIFKAVRAEINDNGSVNVQNNKYTYLDFDVDDDGENVDKIYIRSHKFADIGGSIHDANSDTNSLFDAGAMDNLYTSDVESWRAYNHNAKKIVQAIKPTKKQLEIIKFKMQGYGNKSIATKFNVKPDTVKSQIKNLKNKALKAGYTARPERANVYHNLKRDFCIFAENYENAIKKLVSDFKSLGHLNSADKIAKKDYSDIVTVKVIERPAPEMHNKYIFTLDFSFIGEN